MARWARRASRSSCGCVDMREAAGVSRREEDACHCHHLMRKSRVPPLVFSEIFLAMTPERYALVCKLFQGAIALPHPERPIYLTQECAGDDSLRGEVEAMLAADQA